MAIVPVVHKGCLALVLAASFVCPHGHVPLARAANAGDLSRARAKFQEATALEEAGKYADALEVFRAVGQVRMTPQVRFHIATCEEKLGRLVAALGGYELALKDGANVGPEFQQETENRASAVRARIAKLIIQRGEGARAATIELDGVSLGVSSIGVEVPLDPGSHTIQARAPGFKGYDSSFEVQEGQIVNRTVVLEATSDKASPVSASKGSAPTAEEENPEAASVDTGSVAPAPSKSRVVPYAVGGFGAAAILNAGVFYLLWHGKNSDLESLCGADHNCTNATPRPLVGDEVARSKNLSSTMHAYSAVSQISAVAGVVALGVAGGLIVFEPKQPKAMAAWSIQPVAPGAQLGGLSVIRAF
jgi:hypothetical protein